MTSSLVPLPKCWYRDARQTSGNGFRIEALPLAPVARGFNHGVHWLAVSDAYYLHDVSHVVLLCAMRLMMSNTHWALPRSTRVALAGMGGLLNSTFAASCTAVDGDCPFPIGGAMQSYFFLVGCTLALHAAPSFACLMAASMPGAISL